MKPTILVIEDNEQNLYLVTYILEKNGYPVIQGVELARQVKPGLILLDIQLPVLDGYTVARLLRSTPELSHTPIVAVTSDAMVGDRESALEAGCDGYIEKPIVPETFMKQIEQYLPQVPANPPSN